MVRLNKLYVILNCNIPILIILKSVSDYLVPPIV